MRKPIPIDLDWEKLDDTELPEELIFVELDTLADPAEQRELEKFLREFQEYDPSMEILSMHSVGEDESDT